MKYVVTGEQMKRYDNETIEKVGVPGLVLMERAAVSVLEEIKGLFAKEPQEKGRSAAPAGTGKSSLRRKSALILSGVGNNGADGLALARLLWEEAWEVEVWLVGNPDKASDMWNRQAEILRNYPVRTGSKPSGKEYTIVVDALFGVGLSREVTGEYFEAIQQYNRLKGCKIAVDIPSGVCADNGRILGTAAYADLTVTFGFLKRGLLYYPGCTYCGRVKVHSLGIGIKSLLKEGNLPSDLPEMFCYDEDITELLPQRSPQGNKGTFGKVLLVAGSKNMAGAAVLAARAAYRAGAGMVKVISPAENRTVLQSAVPEALFGVGEELEEACSWADVIAVGPGLSRDGEAFEKLRKVVYESKLPLILDADALNLLAENRALWDDLAKQGCAGRELIFTPHVGELARLLNSSAASVQQDLPKAGMSLARCFKGVAAAKDARTFVCDGRGDGFGSGTCSVCVNTTGNSGMATAGSGDVLTGIVAGLLAQGMEAFKAACVGAYLHGKAGEQAAALLGEHAVMAGDIVEQLGKLTVER